MRLNLKFTTIMLPLIFAILEILSFAAKAQDYPLETLKRDEYLALPSSIQGMYIAGLLDGTTFTAYGLKFRTLNDWQNCVRQKTLEETTNEVTSFLKENDTFNNPIAWALAAVIETRCNKIKRIIDK